MADVGCRMCDVGCVMSDVGCRMLDVGILNLETFEHEAFEPLDAKHLNF
jgi:hypothetical protein